MACFTQCPNLGPPPCTIMPRDLGSFLACGTSPLIAQSPQGPLECSVQSSCTQGGRDLPHPASPETGPKTRNESVQRLAPLQDGEPWGGEAAGR